MSTPVRFGALLGVGVLVPGACWFVSHVLGAPRSPADVARQTGVLLHGLWMAQALAIALAVPRGVGARTRDALQYVGAMMIVPLPLLAIAHQCGGASASSIARATAVLVLLAVIAFLCARGLERLARGSESRALLLGAQELVTVATVWAVRLPCLTWIGLG